MNPETELLYQTVVGLYQGLLGRAPEIEGLEFWAETIASGTLTFQDLIDSFAETPEFETVNPGLGDDVSPEELATIFYQNLLGREPDAAGLEFWTDLLASGTLEPGSFTAAFLETPEADARLGDAIDNYIEDAADGTINDPENEGPLVEDDPQGGGDTDEPEGPGEEPGGGAGGGGGHHDTTPPTVVVSVDDRTVAEGGTATVTFTFSEAVTGFTLEDDVVPSGGTLAGLTKVSANVYEATFTAGDQEGAASVTVTEESYTDLSGNTGAGARVDLIVSANPVTLWDTVNEEFVASYDNLQDAIDAAGVAAGEGNTGYLINVAGDLTISEEVVINVPGLTVLGHGQTLNSGVHVLADAIGARIEGFTISGLVDGKTGTIFVRANDVSIANNEIVAVPDAVTGIETVHGVSGLEIGGNDITGFSGYGVYLNSPEDATISGNTFEDNRYGVLFQDGSAPEISGNTFDGSVAADVGAWAYRGTDPVSLSSISGNTHNGEADDVRVLSTGGHEVVGTSGDDVFVELAEGNDIFSGGGGNDLLDGGLGDDTITGGTGADLIDLSDGGSDIVAYGTFEDSPGLTFAGLIEDQIIGWNSADDKIDLTAFGDLEFYGNDDGFEYGHSYGIYYNHSDDGNTTVYVGEAQRGSLANDFSVELVGTHDLVEANFVADAVA